MNERALGQLSVLNHSHYNLEYHWKLSISEERYRGLEEKGRSLVKITPKEGVVEPHDCIRCELAFSPPSKMTLKGCELTLEVWIPYIMCVIKYRAGFGSTCVLCPYNSRN